MKKEKVIYNDMTIELLNKIDMFFQLYDEIVKSKDSALKHQSDMDKELSNVYHLVEGVETKHVTESHKMFMHLKSVLNKRRMSKLPASLSQAFFDILDDKIKKTKETKKTLIDKHNVVLKEISCVGKFTDIEKKLNINHEKRNNLTETK